MGALVTLPATCWANSQGSHQMHRKRVKAIVSNVRESSRGKDGMGMRVLYW